jgi:23S rRNA (uracil1939-C5)-methyltransferase
MNASALHLNETITCRIEKLVYGGDGLARLEGRVVFIPGTCEGELVRARITQLKTKFARAQVCEIVAPAAGRMAPCCRVADVATGSLQRVPGCVYDHLDYAVELQAKQQQLESFLNRLPNTASAPVFLPAVPSPAVLHYRNKIVLHATCERGETRLGYREEPAHRVIDMAACPLACEAINAALAELRARHLSDIPHGADLTFRFTPHDGPMWWINSRFPFRPAADWLTENSPAGPLRVPRDGFYQVNPSVGDALVRTVAAWFAESKDCSEILDLYCGVGVFGFACMAAGGARLSGIESGRSAVIAAQMNAQTLGVAASFRCFSLGLDSVSVAEFMGNPARTTAIVDPPRDGMTTTMTRALAESGIARVFYVSCDPATLARDLALLCVPGRYRLVRTRLFDLFPRTAHFETLVELRRD